VGGKILAEEKKACLGLGPARCLGKGVHKKKKSGHLPKREGELVETTLTRVSGEGKKKPGEKSASYNRRGRTGKAPNSFWEEGKYGWGVVAIKSPHGGVDRYIQLGPPLGEGETWG